MKAELIKAALYNKIYFILNKNLNNKSKIK